MTKSACSSPTPSPHLRSQQSKASKHKHHPKAEKRGILTDKAAFKGDNHGGHETKRLALAIHVVLKRKNLHFA